jgi:hypothetical protein
MFKQFSHDEENEQSSENEDKISDEDESENCGNLKSQLSAMMKKAEKNSQNKPVSNMSLNEKLKSEMGLFENRNKRSENLEFVYR